MKAIAVGGIVESLDVTTIQHRPLRPLCLLCVLNRWLDGLRRWFVVPIKR